MTARTGTRSDISVTSFARTHALTAGGNGGLVGVDDEEQLDRCLSLRRWGRRSESYLFGSRKGQHERFGQLADGTPYDMVFVFDTIGYNFEPSELGAAYGLVQLRKLDRFNGQRQANWQRLQDFLSTRDGVTPGRTTAGARTTWMRFCLAVDEDAPFTRTQAAGVPRRAGHRDPDGLDGQHPPPAGLRRDRAPGAGGGTAELRPGDGPIRCRCRSTTGSTRTTWASSASNWTLLYQRYA